MIKIIDTKTPDKVTDIDLSEVEWYHRLRNQLYHQGNGLTVEREKIDKYLYIAKDLFKSLLEDELEFEPIKEYEILIKFLMAWSNFEKAIIDLKVMQGDSDPVFKNTSEAVNYFMEIVGYYDLPQCFDQRYQLENIWNLWSDIVSGDVDFRAAEITDETFDLINLFISQAREYQSN